MAAAPTGLPGPDPGWDPPGPPTGAARAARPLVSWLARVTWRLQVHGYEQVPREGPVILAANHTGLLDGPLLYAVVRRPVHALVKQEMFAGVLGRALLAGGQIPIDRFGYDVGAIRNCLAVLRRGGVLAVFPEGTRGAGDFARTRPGAAYLALCTGAPIVPVASLGVRAPGQPTRGIPRPRSTIDVVFGAPIETTPIAWPRRRRVVRERADSLADSLRAHVRHACALTGRELPGRPVGSPAHGRPGPSGDRRGSAGERPRPAGEQRPTTP